MKSVDSGIVPRRVGEAFLASLGVLLVLAGVCATSFMLLMALVGTDGMPYSGLVNSACAAVAGVLLIAGRGTLLRWLGVDSSPSDSPEDLWVVGLAVVGTVHGGWAFLWLTSWWLALWLDGAEEDWLEWWWFDIAELAVSLLLVWKARAIARWRTPV